MAAPWKMVSADFAMRCSDTGNTDVAAACRLYNSKIRNMGVAVRRGCIIGLNRSQAEDRVIIDVAVERFVTV
jgi:hypothetical protein